MNMSRQVFISCKLNMLKKGTRRETESDNETKSLFRSKELLNSFLLLVLYLLFNSFCQLYHETRIQLHKKCLILCLGNLYYCTFIDRKPGTFFQVPN